MSLILFTTEHNDFHKRDNFSDIHFAINLEKEIQYDDPAYHMSGMAEMFENVYEKYKQQLLDEFETDKIYEVPLYRTNKLHEIKTIKEKLEYFAEVFSHAEDIGKRDQLNDKLEFLDNWGNDGTDVKLSQDFAPYSFNLYMVDDGGVIMNGGLIFHDHSQEWSVHT